MNVLYENIVISNTGAGFILNEHAEFLLDKKKKNHHRRYKNRNISTKQRLCIVQYKTSEQQPDNCPFYITFQEEQKKSLIRKARQ